MCSSDLTEVQIDLENATIDSGEGTYSGTDYHGENRPNINIGFGYENKPLKTPYEFLFKMKEKHAGI